MVFAAKRDEVCQSFLANALVGQMVKVVVGRIANFAGLSKAAVSVSPFQVLPMLRVEVLCSVLMACVVLHPSF